MFVRLGWKACQGQTLYIITKIRKLRTKKFNTIGPGVVQCSCLIGVIELMEAVSPKARMIKTQSD